MVVQKEITLPSYSRGYHIITSHILKELNNMPANGLLNIFLHHTSAGLMINENADPTVQVDLERIFNHIVPENMSFVEHSAEGADDMPAHIKSALTGVSLTIPITDGKLKLGTWQGIFLCEFRNSGGSRKITLSVYH